METRTANIAVHACNLDLLYVASYFLLPLSCDDITHTLCILW